MTTSGALSKLIQDLKISLKTLNDDTVVKELRATLHDLKQFPNKMITTQVVEAVDLLEELNFLLKPNHMILTDHFLGLLRSLFVSLLCDKNVCGPSNLFRRLHEYQMPYCGRRAQSCRRSGQRPKITFRSYHDLTYSKSFRMLGIGSFLSSHTFLYYNIDIHQEY